MKTSCAFHSPLWTTQLFFFFLSLGCWIMVCCLPSQNIHLTNLWCRSEVFFNFHLLKIHFRRFLYNNFDSFFIFFLQCVSLVPVPLCLQCCFFWFMEIVEVAILLGQIFTRHRSIVFVVSWIENSWAVFFVHLFFLYINVCINNSHL